MYYHYGVMEESTISKGGCLSNLTASIAVSRLPGILFGVSDLKYTAKILADVKGERMLTILMGWAIWLQHTWTL